MQRSGAMRGQVNGSVKSRLGFPGGRKNNVQVGGRLVGGGLQGRIGGVGIKKRLGAGKGVAAVAIGEIRDARQKINLTRVQKGRITDAREKIQEKRQKKAILGNKIKNLRITAATDMVLARRPMMAMSDMSMNHMMMMERRRDNVGQSVVQDMRGRLSRTIPGHEDPRVPPPRYTDSYSRDTKSAGFFRSDAPQLFSPPPMMMPMPVASYAPHPHVTRSMGGGGYPSGMRIAPPSDDFMLTRTIRNPNAGYASSRDHDMHDRRSSPMHSVAKIAPSMQYASYNRSSSHDQPMDEDEPVISRRSAYSSASSGSSSAGCKILVSNLQASVTTDDIVELFSDIGQLAGARMTSAGHAEVTYAKKYDAMKAIETYHNRLLDGSAMRVFLESSSTVAVSSSSSTALKSASGASIKLPKSASAIKIQPDISAIHKVLFNPGSSGTRGLFKGGQ